MDTQKERQYTEKEVQEAVLRLILTDSTGTVREVIAYTIFDSFAVDRITPDPDQSIANKAFADAKACLEKIRAPDGDTYITYSKFSGTTICVSFQKFGDPSKVITLSGGIDEDGEVYVNESHMSNVSG